MILYLAQPYGPAAISVWSADGSYTVGNISEEGGSLWICINPVSGSGMPPGIDPTNWALFLTSNSIYSVRDYGAVGDGTTNDRPAFVLALAAAAAAGGSIRCTAGTYLLSTALTVTKPIVFDGGAKIKPASAQAVTLSGGYEAEDTQQVFDISDGGSVVIANRDDVSPYHFGAVGNGVANDYLPLQAALSTTVKNVRLAGGVFATQTGLTSSLDNRTIDLAGGELKQDANGITQLILITGDTTIIKDGSITGNSGGTTDLVTFQGTSFCRAENLSVSNSSDSGVRFISCYHCYATGLYCTNNHNGVGSTGSGNLQASNSSYVVFSDIICYETNGKGVAFSGVTGGSLDGLVCTKAVAVSDGYDAGFYVQGGNGIALSNIVTTNVLNKISSLTYDVTVVNFTASTNQFRPLFIQGARRVKIIGATITTSNTAGDSDACAVLTHGVGLEADNVEFIDCSFKSTGTPSGVFASDATTTNVRFVNCKFTDSGNQSGYSASCMVLNPSYTEYTNCRFEYTGSGAIPLLLNTAGGFTADGCTFTSTVVGHTLVLTSASGAIVKRSKVTCTRGTGIQASAPIQVLDSEITCLGGASSSEVCIRLDAGSLGSVIRNCTIDAVGGTGIWFTGASVEGVKIERCTVNGVRSIYITQSTTNKVLDCIVSGAVGILGVVTNALNGTVNPGRHTHKSGNTHFVYGTPEGVIAAEIGDVASSLDGSVGTCFYVKESGTGSSGWVSSNDHYAGIIVEGYTEGTSPRTITAGTNDKIMRLEMDPRVGGQTNIGIIGGYLTSGTYYAFIGGGLGNAAVTEVETYLAIDTNVGNQAGFLAQRSTKNGHAILGRLGVGTITVPLTYTTDFTGVYHRSGGDDGSEQTRTSNTIKRYIHTMPTYVGTGGGSDSLVMLYASSDSTDSTIDIGGNNTLGHAATSVTIWSTATPNSGEGTAIVAVSINGLAVTDAKNFALGTTTGTKIGTATTQKIGFWNATPVVQPVSADQAVVTLGNTNSEIGGLTISAAYSDTEVIALRDKCEELADDVRALSTLLHAIRTALVNSGLIKGSAA